MRAEIMQERGYPMLHFLLLLEARCLSWTAIQMNQDHVE